MTDLSFIQPFGPQIAMGELPTDVNDELLAICLELENDVTKRMNTQLVGMIEKEYRIKNELVASRTMPIIRNAVLDYLNTAPSIYSAHAPFHDYDIFCTDAWCNVQEAGEFNPIHSHPFDDIVVVLYPYVDIDIHHRKFNRATKIETPGSLVFHCQTSDRRYGRQSYRVMPQTGKFYVFPGSLEHFTMPSFNENDRRISIGCNFALRGQFLDKYRRYSE